MNTSTEQGLWTYIHRDTLSNEVFEEVSNDNNSSAFGSTKDNQSGDDNNGKDFIRLVFAGKLRQYGNIKMKWPRYLNDNFPDTIKKIKDIYKIIK